MLVDLRDLIVRDVAADIDGALAAALAEDALAPAPEPAAVAAQPAPSVEADDPGNGGDAAAVPAADASGALGDSPGPAAIGADAAPSHDPTDAAEVAGAQAPAAPDADVWQSADNGSPAGAGAGTQLELMGNGGDAENNLTASNAAAPPAAVPNDGTLLPEQLLSADAGGALEPADDQGVPAPAELPYAAVALAVETEGSNWPLSWDGDLHDTKNVALGHDLASAESIWVLDTGLVPPETETAIPEWSAAASMLLSVGGRDLSEASGLDGNEAAQDPLTLTTESLDQQSATAFAQAAVPQAQDVSPGEAPAADPNSSTPAAGDLSNDATQGAAEQGAPEQGAPDAGPASAGPIPASAGWWDVGIPQPEPLTSQTGISGSLISAGLDQYTDVVAVVGVAQV